MAPTARELLQRREEQRRADQLRSVLTTLRGHNLYENDHVLTDWSEAELSALGRTDSVPESTLSPDAAPDQLAAWLEDLENRAGLGTRVFLGTSLQYMPWLECEVIRSGWLAEAWTQAGGALRVIAADRRRLLVIFDEEHGVEAFLRRDPRT